MGDRISTSGFDLNLTISTSPLAIRVGQSGIGVVFRYGVAVLTGLTAVVELSFVESLELRIASKLTRYEEEIAAIELVTETADQAPAGGPLRISSFLLGRRRA